MTHCGLCGIRVDNHVGIPVRSYSMIRRDPAARATRSFGTLRVCDRCVDELRRGATFGPGGGSAEAAELAEPAEAEELVA